MTDKFVTDELRAPGYQQSERDKAIAAARNILNAAIPQNDASILVSRYLLRTLGVGEEG